MLAGLVLAGLIVLPVIWWLLRMTPPRPQTEIFPPLRILAGVLKREETPHQSPWWLTLLRLLMATLIILALADPVLNPRERMAAGGGATAIMLDNGWASATDWDMRVATAERLIADAEATGVPVVLALTAEEPNAAVGPFDAAAARDRLNAARPKPVPVDRAEAAGRIAAALDGLSGAGLALLTDGLSAEDEARQAAARAWRDGHRRIGVLVPDNDWGRRVGEAFWDEWQARGGEVTNAVRYNPGASATESTRRAVSNPRPDALFLLALPDYARQVPPTLDYYGAGNLPVYATSHLFEGRLNPRLDHDLDDVQFLDIPWQIPDAAVGGVEVLPFLDSYRALREESDPRLFRLHAMGVDAFELARRLPQLQAVQGSELRGATGTLRPGSDGRIQRQLPWARFVNGVPQPVLIPGIFGDDRAR
mgnify:CR=1 FL=1